MNTENRCFCELAPLYALDLLTEEERAWVEQQAAASPDLKAELEEIQTTVGALSYSAPVVPVPSTLKDRLFERLNQPIPDAELSLPNVRQPVSEDRRFAQNAAPQEPRPRRWRSLWQQNSAIAASVLLGVTVLGSVILGIENYRLRQTVQANQSIIATLQQPNTNIYALRGTEKAANASGKIAIDPGRNSFVVLVQNLPNLPANQAYRLWAISPGRTQPNYCGQFTSREAAIGHQSTLPSGCASPAIQLLITAESTVAPLVPAGPLMMRSL
ncbi:anti-sigma factor [Cyanobacteria bacterium FACHB-63]|nr:anti-sigma factor [Cyanobacteria bacterium FACHB-63]